jgi:predicted O-methyltransferase YrrM
LTPDFTTDFKLLHCTSAVADEVYSTRRVPTADGRSVPMDVYIPREQGDYLYSLVRYLRPARTLEIGMANGLSSLFIAQALRDNGSGKHTALDPFQYSDWAGAGVALIQKAGLTDLIELVGRFCVYRRQPPFRLCYYRFPV